MKTRQLKYGSFLIFTLLAFTFLTSSQVYGVGKVPENVINAFKIGNHKEISKFFNENIELEILGQEGIYGCSQAEQILKSFFAKNAPKNFTIMHEGGKESALYAIGKLETATGTYRINFLFKSRIILQIRIEADNGN